MPAKYTEKEVEVWDLIIAFMQDKTAVLNTMEMFHLMDALVALCRDVGDNDVPLAALGVIEYPFEPGDEFILAGEGRATLPGTLDLIAPAPLGLVPGDKDDKT